MRMVDVSCDGEVDETGMCTLTIKATNLTMDEARAIGERAKEPFRQIVHDVVGKGERLETRDMNVKPQ